MFTGYYPYLTWALFEPSVIEGEGGHEGPPNDHEIWHRCQA